MLTLLSLYSGGGIADRGFRDAGFNLVSAVERDPQIAYYHNLNLGNHCINASVSEVDYSQFKGVDVLFMSPPCRASSIANPNRGENHPDWLLGEEAINPIKTLKPRWVILENVRGYVNNPAFKAICCVLAERGYFFHYEIINCADFGVPQHRNRLILIASLDGFFLFPQFVEVWKSWYSAIADLLPDCEDSDLPNWARKLLKDRGLIKGEKLLINDQNVNGSPIWEDNSPSFTITNRQGQKVLLPRAGASSKVAPTYINEPSPTVRSLEKGGHSHHFDAVSIIDEYYIVKKLSPRCLARLMSLPDDYILPDKKGLATTILGNGFPTLAAKQIGEWVFNQSLD